MKRLVPVSEIMSKEVIAITQDDGLDVAEHLFKKHHIRHIPVVKGKRIVGMLSLTDLLRISFADEVEDEEEVETIVYNMFTIDQVMTKNLISVSPDSTIKEVAEILASKEFHALPVVLNDDLVGIVTTTDLIKYLLKQY
ncbi:CBS domain-containing protein [Mangrovimonas sp. AS39]|uniref:CBS domain-containing protein n=1 Tax=Mangrovimonas futianensis TaxID=2895523 RepID=UPI001E4B3EC8|nr:CBS domain-containing protein [Mangrovimonas futianensis]MCF1190975.1 CBS domain-containing protein [Mangrovimonas futianensis]MCF1194671.1 CBS domain-containing protein [Mangrovimonas futianensis]